MPVVTLASCNKILSCITISDIYNSIHFFNSTRISHHHRWIIIDRLRLTYSFIHFNLLTLTLAFVTLSFHFDSLHLHYYINSWHSIHFFNEYIVLLSWLKINVKRNSPWYHDYIIVLNDRTCTKVMVTFFLILQHNWNIILYW